MEELGLSYEEMRNVPLYVVTKAIEYYKYKEVQRKILEAAERRRVK